MSQDHFCFSMLASMADANNRFVTLLVDLIEEGTFVVGLAF